VTDPKDDESAPTIEIVEKRRRPEGSLPEIKIGYAPAGRATLEAIADELAPHPLPPLIEESSSPVISVRESFAEHETLAAILAEARGDGETAAVPSVPASNAAPGPAVVPVAVIPVAAALPPAAPSPEEDEESLAVTAVRKVASPPQAAPLEILEMVTFIVRGADAARLASEPLRRQFVEERLLARLPVTSMAAVDRVDAAPWTAPGTLVIRVFCKTLG
jgi:hypothetical protein